VGLNYRSHIAEMKREFPKAPTLFTKLPRALADPGEVVIPADAGNVDYEGELAVVIGRGGRRIPEEEALAHVGGFTIANDTSMRDFQRRSLQWFAGKTWEQCTPIGPVLITPDEVEDGFADRELRTTVNGEERQRATLGDLVFPVPHLVADLSRLVTLEPGDIILTGTTGGVAEAMEPQRWVEDGDVVEVSITGFSPLRATFRRESG
jgi:acylpyruvate hydrolase